MPEYISPPSSLKAGSLVWAYLRDSGGDGQEQSIPQQKAEIEKFCKQHGFMLAHVFADVAKSGGSVVGRNSFNDMIDMSADRELKPAGLLLWNFARFARDLDDSSYYKSILRKHGLIIHSLTDPIPEGQYGRVVETFIDIANEEKRRQTSRDVKRALAALVRQGYASGGFPPRGYKAEQVIIGMKRDGKPRTVSKWVPDPKLWKLVQLSWEMRAEGKSYSEITRATGGKIYKSINCWPTFFNNKTYLGIGKCGDLEVSDHHEAAITQKEWEAVQSLVQASPWYGKTGHPNHPRRKGNPSLLSGMAFCIHCGTAIIHHIGHKGHQWPYYVCGDKDRKKGFNDCKARRVGAKKAEEAILNTVLNRILTRTYFEELLAELRSRMEDSEGLEAEISEKQTALREIDQGIQNLLDLAEAFGAGAALERLKQREVERVGLVAELNQLEAKKEISKVEIAPEALSLAIDTWRGQVLEKVEAGDIPAMKDVLRRFVSKIELGYKQARIEYTYPLDTTTPFTVYSGGGTKIKESSVDGSLCF